MTILAATLIDQAKAALERWPFIPELETQFDLPRWLLLAVGSRETNLSVRYTQGATGDGGHGHGVMQFDDRSHTIPAGFDTDARLQFTTAATMLHDLAAHFKGNWSAALAAYNAGAGAVQRRLDRHEPVDWATTGRDYSTDVLARRDVLDRALDHQPHPLPVPGPVAPQPRPGPAPTSEDDLQPIATDPTNGDYWVLTGPQGGVDSYDVGGQKNDRYYGNLIDHPELDAGEGKGNGPAIAIAYWPGAGNGAGYAIFTRDGTGYVHAYHFDLSTLKV